MYGHAIFAHNLVIFGPNSIVLYSCTQETKELSIEYHRDYFLTKFKNIIFCPNCFKFVKIDNFVIFFKFNVPLRL